MSYPLQSIMLQTSRIVYAVLTIFVLAPSILYCQQAPRLEWSKSLGGSDYEVANCIIQTSDGGYAVAAYASSKDGDVVGNHGIGDGWVIKLDQSGNIKWKKCLGGTGDDYATWIVETSDGGYAVAGKTGSSDGDVAGNHGGEFDGWIVKLDAQGTIIWQKCYGGTSYDQLNSITKCSDGGFAVCGVTYSNDGDVSGNHNGPGDAWVMKLDSAGEIKWQKCYGGGGNDEAICIIQNSSGGFAIAGRTSSSEGDIDNYHGGEFDGFVLMLGSDGNKKWMKCFGGDSLEHFHSIVQTSDGGYAVCGHTNSINGDVTSDHGDMDAWVIKIDSIGSLQWQHCLGGSGDDGTYSVIQTEDKGFVAAGWSSSSDGDASGCHGQDDIWVAKIDSGGRMLWQKCLGGSQPENANSMVITSDGGYAVAGFTNSSDGDVIGNHGSEDVWILKLTPASGVASDQSTEGILNIYPNPVTQAAQLNYILETRSHVTIEIYTILGQKMETLLDEWEDAGNIENEIDLGAITSGSYFMRFNINGRLSTKAVRVTK
ncbi:MAG: T9SS type A sorting domain-containing protein [Bacteroidota bacterium]|nr:T9SS type A sorting domain-containing protein [Bacteroidota bacterium]